MFRGSEAWGRTGRAWLIERKEAEPDSSLFGRKQIVFVPLTLTASPSATRPVNPAVLAAVQLVFLVLKLYHLQI